MPWAPASSRPAHPHELALGGAGDDVGGADAGGSHQRRGGFVARGVMLEVEPDAVEAEQADELIDGGVDEMAAGDEGGLAAGAVWL